MEDEHSERRDDVIGALPWADGSMEMRRHYLQNLLHELSTPLTPLMGYIKLFKNGSLGELTPLQTRCINSMQTAADRLNRRLDDVSILLAMESGTYHLEPEPVGFVLLVEQALERYKGIALESEIELIPEIDPAAEDLEVLGDERRLKLAIEHLISNGLKFNSPGGKLFVRVQRLTKADGDWICLETYDSGIGIKTEELTRVFEPFYQVDHTAIRRFRGAGLGLSLIRWIITKHNGTVVLESPPSVQPKGHFFRGVRAVIELKIHVESAP